MDIIYRINGGALTLLANQTSPTNISGTADDVIEVWLSEKQTATVLAAAGSIDYVGGATQTEVGATANYTVSLTGLTGGLASAPAENDFVVVGYAVATQGTVPTMGVVSSGWTALTVINGVDTRACYLQLFYKRMGATPDTSIEVDGTGSLSNAAVFSVQVFRGVDATTPLDVTPTSSTGGNTRFPNPAAITPTTSGAVVCVVGGGSNSNISTLYTSSDLSNFISAYSNDSVDVSIGAGTFAWSSGAFDPAAFAGGADSANESWAAYTLALRPA